MRRIHLSDFKRGMSIETGRGPPTVASLDPSRCSSCISVCHCRDFGLVVSCETRDIDGDGVRETIGDAGNVSSPIHAVAVAVTVTFNAYFSR